MQIAILVFNTEVFKTDANLFALFQVISMRTFAYMRHNCNFIPSSRL